MLEGLDDMDPELRQALLMSMQDSVPAPEAEPAEPPAKKAKGPEEEKKEEAAAPAAPSGDVPAENIFQDMAFVQDLLGGLPGVNMQDERIQEALRSVGVDSKPDKPEDKDKDKDEKKDGDS